MGALFRSGWGGRGNRRRTAHAQEPPGLRCGVAKFARQQMGFSRDKSLERVRAEPAVAPPDGGMARMKGSTAIALPATRARNRGTCVPNGSPATNIPNPKTGARQRSALAVGKQRHSAPPQRPLPHRGKAASKSPNPTIPECTEPIKRTHKETKAIRSTIRRPTQSVHHSLPGRSFLTTQSKPQSNIAAIMNQGSKKRIHES